MGSGGDLLMSEGGDAVPVLSRMMGLLGPLIRDPGVLQSLTGVFRPREVLLLSPMFGGATMRVRSRFMELGGFLVIVPVGSVARWLRHTQRLSICPDFVWASLASW